VSFKAHTRKCPLTHGGLPCAIESNERSDRKKLNQRLPSIKNVAVCSAGLAIGYAIGTLLPLDSESAPEFYGAFSAAFIAAAGLIFVTYFSDSLTNKRDEKLRADDRKSEAIDLCFWLEHCDHELEFVESALTRIREKLSLEGKTAVPIPLNQFKEVISSHFYGELLERAKAASRLTPEIAGLVAGDLYKTFTVVDRLFLLRQATSDYQPSVETIDQYIFVIGRRRKTLQDNARLLGEYLIQAKALPRFPSKDN